MNKKPEGMLFFGFPDEGERFQQRHPLWVERFPNLARAIDMAFTRVQVMPAPEDKFVYLFGRMCAEDFMEILLVCGNGYGAAGMKLLRTMYEHTVTLRYLHEHPDEVGGFMDYHRVQQDKLMKPILEVFGNGVLPPDTVADVERKFAEVKDDFMVTDCKTCGTKRLNHTWNKLDFVSMAKKTGSLGTLIVPGYFLPLRHAHSTFGGLSERLQIANERMEFQGEPQTELADQALAIAHNCILNVLEVQKERFKIGGLSEQLQTCFSNYLEIWVPDSKPLNPRKTVCLGCGESLPWGWDWNMTDRRFCPSCGADRWIGFSDEPRRVSPETAEKLLAHRTELADLGLSISTADSVQKSDRVGKMIEITLDAVALFQIVTGKSISIPAIAKYVKEELHIPDNEIIQLRLNNLELEGPEITQSSRLAETSGRFAGPDPHKSPTTGCLWCKAERQSQRRLVSGQPRECPLCDHVFRGNGWDGIDAHWRARHDDEIPYEQFWDRLCDRHRRHN